MFCSVGIGFFHGNLRLKMLISWGNRGNATE